MSKVLADRLRQVRENKRKTQRDVAQVVGISDVGYGAWERGTNEPSIENLVKLCRYFNVSSDWLIGIDKEEADRRTPLVGRIEAIKTEADQAAATLSRLLGEIKTLEGSI